MGKLLEYHAILSNNITLHQAAYFRRMVFSPTSQDIQMMLAAQVHLGTKNLNYQARSMGGLT